MMKTGSKWYDEGKGKEKENIKTSKKYVSKFGGTGTRIDSKKIGKKLMKKLNKMEDEKKEEVYNPRKFRL